MLQHPNTNLVQVLGVDKKQLNFIPPQSRAVYPQLFCTDPDPAVILNADPDSAAFLMRIRIRLYKIC